MTTLKAAVVHTFGRPLKIEETPVSEVTDGQVLVTAVSRTAFTQALAMLHKRDTMSIVGTRKDLQEALEFAGEGKVRTPFVEDRLDNITAIFARMKHGDIEGRVVMRIGESS